MGPQRRLHVSVILIVVRSIGKVSKKLSCLLIRRSVSSWSTTLAANSTVILSLTPLAIIDLHEFILIYVEIRSRRFARQ
jgi:hypothetical protein